MTIVTTLAAFAAGVAGAGGLWLIAARISETRGLGLGSQPPWLLLVCGAGAAGTGYFFAPDVALAAGICLIGAIVCALVDARTGYIFDGLTGTIAGAAGCVAIFDGRGIDGALGVVVVGGALTALYVITGRRGIGLGDVKLGSAIALGYGLDSAIVAIGSAFVIGALYAGMLIGLGRAKRTDPVRFGPFIAGGAAVGLTAGALGWRW